MKVSVALATYNGERYLAEQLDSLAGQTLTPAELVIADDGSCDHTTTIIESFRKKAPFPIPVMSGQHLGYVGNFFRAVKVCRGDVIALCDQDDIWQPEKLSVCLNYFRHHVTLVMHSAQVIDSFGRPLNKRAPIIARTRELPRGIFHDGPLKSFPLGFSLVIHRRVIDATMKALSFYPEILGHYFGHEMPSYWMAKAQGNIVYLSRELVFYRRHEANTSQGQALKNEEITAGWHKDVAAYREFGQHAQYQADLLMALMTGSDPDTDAILIKMGPGKNPAE